MPITAKILEHAEAQPEGAFLSAKGLLHLGSRAAVDQALSRLARSGHLIRAGRGLYVSPVHARFGSRAPKPGRVVEGLSAATGETVAPGGAAAANSLGLTSQMPIRPFYLTTGRSRHLWLGKQRVELKHAPRWQLYAPHRAAGQAVRALAWLGPRHAAEAARLLKARLPLSERQALVAARPQLPTWLAQVVSEAFEEEAARSS